MHALLDLQNGGVAIDSCYEHTHRIRRIYEARDTCTPSMFCMEINDRACAKLKLYPVTLSHTGTRRTVIWDVGDIQVNNPHVTLDFLWHSHLIQ